MWLDNAGEKITALMFRIDKLGGLGNVWRHSMVWITLVPYELCIGMFVEMKHWGPKEANILAFMLQ